MDRERHTRHSPVATRLDGDHLLRRKAESQRPQGCPGGRSLSYSVSSPN